MSFTLAGRLTDPDRAAAGDYCPIDRAIRAVGSRASLLLLREAAYGTTREGVRAAAVEAGQSPEDAEREGTQAGRKALVDTVAKLTGVEGARIFPLWPPAPPAIEPQPDETTTLVDLVAVCGDDPASASFLRCGAPGIAV